MNGLDYIFLAALLGGLLYGLARGVVMVAAQVLILVAGMFIGGRMGGVAAGLFGAFTDNEQLARMLGFIVIFLVVAIALNLVARLLKGVMEAIDAGKNDKWLGMIIGGLAGFMICAVIFVAVVEGGAEDREGFVEESKLAPYVGYAVNGVSIWVNSDTSQKIGNYLAPHAPDILHTDDENEIESEIEPQYEE